MYRFNLLGPPQLLWCGQSLSIDRRQQRLLLYVIVASPQPVARRFLTSLLWPEVPACRAGRLLTRQLSALRNSLPQSELLTISRDHAMLNRTMVTVDLWTIDECAKPQRTQPAGNGSIIDSATCQKIEQAAILYRGPLLAGVNFDPYPELHDWLLGQQPLWEEKVVTLLNQLVDGFTARQEYPTAIAYARRLLEIDPAHEETHRTLIELYSATGQRTAALRQYEECINALAAISLQPSPATDRTFEAACEMLMV